MINKNTKFLIVGLGVIGGSYASALTARGYDVSGITLSEDDIDYALSHGMIARGSTRPDADLIAGADIIVFALYPHTFVEWIGDYQQLFRPGTLITDVTGVKTNVVDRIQSILRQDVEFIAAHPMAGRESSGIRFSDSKVFEGANYIVTPTDRNTKEAIACAKQLGQILGFARISELPPAEHDRMIAFLSQLTHCIAVSLMTCNQTEGLENYTGDSFRDLTRIAKINDEMWSELFLLNRDALLFEMNSFEDSFNRLRGYLLSGDRESMRAMMRQSSVRRNLFDK